MSRRKAAGFTLVELLVVIGIIAVLVAILLPTLNKVRAAGNRTACQNNVRQLAIGVNLYCDANHDWYPTCANPTLKPAFVQYPDDWVYWEADRVLDDSPIGKMLGLKGDGLRNLLRCPADSGEGLKPFPGIGAGQGAYLFSYSINMSVGTNSYPPPSTWRTKRSQWHRPYEKILFTEPRFGPYASACWGYTDPLTTRHGQARNKTDQQMGINATTAFMDGHVQGVDELFSNDIRQIHLDQ